MCMKRFIGLLLALALMLPLGQSLGSDPKGSASPIQANTAQTAGTWHCPTDSPTQHLCEPIVDPQLNVAQIAPRPDTSGAFGAAPAGPAAHGHMSDQQQARAPDLHQLSISRT